MNKKCSIKDEGVKKLSAEQQESAIRAKSLYDYVKNNPDVELISPVDMPTDEEVEELDRYDTWAKGTKNDIQVINTIAKKLAREQYARWDNYSCPMKSRHKTQLMIGLSRLIPTFIKHNKLDSYLTVKQILLHIATVCTESLHKGDEVAWSTVDHMTEELVAQGNDERDPWKEGDDMA